MGTLSSTSVTVILMNYRRPGNIANLVARLAGQSVPVEIVCWNNGERLPEEEHFSASIQSSRNLYCWPRWFIASLAETKYVLIVDDDLYPADNEVLASMISAKDELANPNAIVGPEGVLLQAGEDYWPTYQRPRNRSKVDPTLNSSFHLKDVVRDVRVHIIKGRCMLVSVEAIRDLPISVPYWQNGDDIAVSALLGGAEPIHLVSASLTNRFSDTKDRDGAMAMSSAQNWAETRETIRRYYFK